MTAQGARRPPSPPPAALAPADVQGVTIYEARYLIRLLQADRRKRARQLQNREARGQVFVPEPGHVDMSVVTEAMTAVLEDKLRRAVPEKAES